MENQLGTSDYLRSLADAASNTYDKDRLNSLAEVIDAWDGQDRKRGEAA